MSHSQYRLGLVGGQLWRRGQARQLLTTASTGLAVVGPGLTLVAVLPAAAAVSPAQQAGPSVASPKKVWLSARMA